MDSLSRSQNTVSQDSNRVTSRFIVDDQRHCQRMGQFDSYEAARLAIIGFVSNPWNEKPNRAPCSNWKKCGRHYDIIETSESGAYLTSTPVCKIDCEGVIWLDEPSDEGNGLT